MTVQTKKIIEAVNTLERKSTVHAWNQAISKAIRDTLAPRGFKKAERGEYKGQIRADIHFLSKNSVQKCENIGVLGIVNFRQGLKNKLVDQITKNNNGLEMAKKDLEQTRFWRFSRITGIKNTIIRIEGQNEALKQVWIQ